MLENWDIFQNINRCWAVTVLPCSESEQGSFRGPKRAVCPDSEGLGDVGRGQRGDTVSLGWLASNPTPWLGRRLPPAAERFSDGSTVKTWSCCLGRVSLPSLNRLIARFLREALNRCLKNNSFNTLLQTFYPWFSRHRASHLPCAGEPGGGCAMGRARRLAPGAGRGNFHGVGSAPPAFCGSEAVKVLLWCPRKMKTILGP